MKKFWGGGSSGKSRRMPDPNSMDDSERPSKDQLDKMYAQLLEDLAIPESKREGMLMKDDDHKWNLLKMHSVFRKDPSSPSSSSSGQKKKSASYWVDCTGTRKTNGEPAMTVEDAGELYAVLRTAHKQFLIDFIDGGGVDNLVELTQWYTGRANKRDSEKKILSQLMSCYRALMNNNVGMEGALQTTDSIKTLANGMDLTDETDLLTAQEVVMLLAVTCFYSPEGREAVVEAMDTLRVRWRESQRYQTLVETFKGCDDNEFRAAVIMFITTIVNSAADVENRVRVRNDFLALDILNVFERVLEEAKDEAKEEGNDESYTVIATQYQVFEDMMTEDHKEVTYSLIAGTSTGENADLDLSNMEELFEFLVKSTQLSGCSDLLLELCQNLILIPGARSLAVPTWEAVTQFTREATDYSRRQGAKGIRLNYQLLNDLLDKREEMDERLSQVTSGDDIIGNQRKKIQELQKDIEALRSGKSSKKGGSSAASADKSEEIEILQEQVKKLRGEIAALQKKLLVQNKGKPIEDEIDDNDTSAAVPDSWNGKLDSTGLRPAGVVPGVKSSGIPPCPLPNMKGSLELAPIPAKSGAKTKGAKAPSASKKNNQQDSSPQSALMGMLKARGGASSNSKPASSGVKPPAAPAKSMTAKETEASIRKKLGLPSKKPIQPSVKMRNIFWTPVPLEKIESTIWPELSDQKIKFSTKSLEKKFGQIDKAKSATNGKADKRKSMGKVHLVTGKRQQNIGITVSKIRATDEEIVAAIWSMDETMLSPEHTQVLLTAVPTEDEVELINNFESSNGDIKKLAREDRFLRAVSKIPRLSARLRAVMTRFNFDFDYDRIETKVILVRRAIVEIDRSSKLHKLLEIVLALGNYINGGTPRGAVWGFKLDALQKLDTIKDNSNKSTLMDFLYHVLEKNYPELTDFQLPAAKEAADVSLSDTMSELNQLASAIRSIKTELGNPPHSKKDKFNKVMTGFEVKASKKVTELQTAFEKVRADFHKLATKYAETGTAVEPESFFPKFTRFEIGLGRAKRAVEEKREREERARRLQEEKERRVTLKKMREESGGADDGTFAKFAKANAGTVDDIVQGYRGHATKASSKPSRSKGSSPRSGGSGSSSTTKKKKKKKVKIIKVVGPDGQIIEKKMRKKKKKKPASSVPNADFDIA